MVRRLGHVKAHRCSSSCVTWAASQVTMGYHPEDFGATECVNEKKA
jgi:hypothetical protein